MQYKKIIAGAAAAAVVQGFCPVFFSDAAEKTALPDPCPNLYVGGIRGSYLCSTGDGYMRLFVPDAYDAASDAQDADCIRIEYYDRDFALTGEKTIDRKLEYWGGFFEGQDSYFTVEGTKNTDEIDTNEVVRVNKYDKDWNKLGTAHITGSSDMFGGKVRFPLDYGCCEMTELNGYLYIAMGHQGYVDPTYNQGHQGLLFLMVDESDMTGQVADCDLWHSFSQYLDNDGESIYMLEESEGSRYSLLTRYDPQALPADYFDEQDTAVILEYGGNRDSAWSVATYATCDGIALSEKNVLTLGTSIDQERYGEDRTYNIYLGITPKDSVSTESTSLKWITDLAGESEDVYHSGVNSVAMTKINDDRFLISWNEVDEKTANADHNDPLAENVLHYIFVDGEGNTLGEACTAGAAFSGCRPVFDGSRVVFYASNGNALAFYAIDAASGALEKKVYRSIGENVTWEYDSGVLTVSGTGAMDDLNADDSAWPEQLYNDVIKIVVKGGVTHISEKAFAYFGSLEEVVIENGVESIDKEAFYSCGNLSEITIPASVTSIGEDIIWTGYWWVHDHSHVYGAAIRTTKGSAAEAYAAKYDIRCSILGDVNADGDFDVADVVCLQRWLLGIPDASLADWEAADLCGDGRLNVLDLCLMKRLLTAGQG